MSKMKCQCGFIISNTLYPSQTEGDLIPQESIEEVIDDFCGQAREFFRADKEGFEVRKEWLKKTMGKDYPVDATEEEVFYDIFSDVLNSVVLSVAECKSCGRLHIQNLPGINDYSPFIPEIKGTRILSNLSKRKKHGKATPSPE